MKIVHLIDYYQPKVGYQEFYLAKEHASLGHQTHVVTSNKYFPFPDYENIYKSLLGDRTIGIGEKKEEGVTVIRLKSIEIPGTNIIYLNNLGKTLQKIKPDLVLCHGIYSLTSFFASKLKNQINFKLIYDNHAASFNTDFNKSLSRKIYHYFYKLFFAFSIIKNADKIFAIGEAEQDFICRDLDLNKSDVPIIRLGVDTHIFKFSAQKRKKYRSKYKINKSTPVFIFTGKITPNKDVHILVDALEKLSKTNPFLLLIGGGPIDYLNSLKKSAVKTRIIHIPFVENKKLSDFYSSADIAVWPGDSTIAILEAMSCGLPIILPNWYATEFLSKSPGVVRFQRRKASDLFQKIKTLVYNQNLIHKVGKLNRIYVENNLNWKKIAKIIIDLAKNRI